MKKSLSNQDYELLRSRAWELHKKNWSQIKISEALGVSQSTICKWIKRAKEGGSQAFQRKYSPGAIPKLNQKQLDTLRKNVLVGAFYHGYPDNKWTNKRIQQVIKSLFDIEYTEQHIGRLVKTFHPPI